MLAQVVHLFKRLKHYHRWKRKDNVERLPEIPKSTEENPEEHRNNINNFLNGFIRKKGHDPDARRHLPRTPKICERGKRKK